MQLALASLQSFKRFERSGGCLVAPNTVTRAHSHRNRKSRASAGQRSALSTRSAGARVTMQVSPSDNPYML